MVAQQRQIQKLMRSNRLSVNFYAGCTACLVAAGAAAQTSGELKKLPPSSLAVQAPRNVQPDLAARIPEDALVSRIDPLQNVSLPPALPVSPPMKLQPGAWAEYSLSDGRSGGSLRWSLVAADAKSATLETHLSLPSRSMQYRPLSVAATLALAPKGGFGPARRIVVADSGPTNILMPEVWAENAMRFSMPSEKDFVGLDKVPNPKGGVIEVRRYRQQTDYGVLDVWLSDKVPPLGVARFALTRRLQQASVVGTAQTLTARLIGMGNDATPTITGPTKPFGRDPLATRGPVKQEPGVGVLNQRQ